MEKKINAASVYILDNPYSVDRRFDYYLPDELREKTSPGSFVSLPFGKGNRQMTAVVFDTFFTEEVTRLKAVTQVFDEDGLSLSGEMRKLCLFMKEQTFCTVGDAVRAMVPTGALKGMCACYRAAGKPDVTLNETAKTVYAYIADRSGDPDAGVTGEQLQKKFGRDVADPLQALVRLKPTGAAGFLKRSIRSARASTPCRRGRSSGRSTMPFRSPENARRQSWTNASARARRSSRRW